MGGRTSTGLVVRQCRGARSRHAARLTVGSRADSQTTLSIVGSAGIALVVVAGCLATAEAMLALLGFIAAAVLAATVWVRFFRRGPLEHLLRVATGPAQFVR